MVDVETGKETVLSKRKNAKGKDSRCFFVDWFPFKGYEIQLRLDYDGKPNVSPTLDVDIRDVATGKLIPKVCLWHNIEKKHDPKLNMDIYNFKGFDSLAFRVFTITDAVADQLFSVTPRKP
jgi:hypothetical protein